MRQTFAHDAVVIMEARGDVRAPGAAITVALCGHWEHEPPCPQAPHHTAAERSGDEVRLRVLFAAEPAAELEVRSRIEAALSLACLDGPDGVTTRWQFHSAWASSVREDEAQHAEQLTLAYDNYLVGYRSRSLSVPRAHERQVWPGGGQIRPTVIADGLACGTWTRRRDGRTDVSLFAPGSASAEPWLSTGIAAETADIARFLGEA